MAAPASDFDRGRRIGKYEILTRLSMGGMAELFLAFTSGPGGFRKFVVVKQILPDVKKDEQFVKMFLDEARITAAFSHANIGQVFDLGEEDGELYLAMEFISGQNLELVIKRAAKREKSIPIGFSCRVIRDACLALHYAHQFTEPSGLPAPVVHRDVSPKNVMVTYAGDVKVIDFGIAKATGRLGRTQVGMVKGTSGYMSPEQVRNQALDGRSDLFSAGVMLHELLTGQRLFQAPTDSQMMLKIAEGDVAPPRSANRQVPEALSEIAVRALARQKERRFATGKEMARALEQASLGLMYDEDKCAALMSELFDDKIAATRALLELATRDDSVGSLSGVAAALRDEAADSSQRHATPRRRDSPRASRALGESPSATPARGRVDPLPPADLTGTPEATPSQSGQGAARYVSVVGAKYALYNESESATAPESGGGSEGPAQRVKAQQASITGVRPQLRPLKGEAGGAHRKRRVSLFWVSLLLLVAGLSYGTTRLHGPFGEAVMPHYLQAAGWAGAQLAGEPPALPPEKIVPSKPAEPPPEALRLLAPNEPDGPITQLPENYVDTPVPPEKSEPEKKVRTTRPLNPEGDARVLDTRSRSGAAKSGVGWLTLFTVPPTPVYDGATLLGSTPLVKVPLEEGYYKLELLDGDGNYRILSVPIKPGEETQMKIRVSDLPLGPPNQGDAVDSPPARPIGLRE